EQRPAERGLAASGLADEAEHFAFPDVERDTVERLDASSLASDQAVGEAAPDRVIGLQVANGDERRVVFRLHPRLRSARARAVAACPRASPAPGLAASRARAGRFRAAARSEPSRRTPPSRSGNAGGND